MALSKAPKMSCKLVNQSKITQQNWPNWPQNGKRMSLDSFVNKFSYQSHCATSPARKKPTLPGFFTQKLPSSACWKRCAKLLRFFAQCRPGLGRGFFLRKKRKKTGLIPTQRWGGTSAMRPTPRYYNHTKSRARFYSTRGLMRFPRSFMAVVWCL